jgi:type VI secretion system protein ImpL
VTVKNLLVSLFLYVSLAWVGAAYLYTGPEIIHRALLLTAIGLIAILAFLILSRVFGWWRLWRARAASKSPRPQSTPSAPLHPDDQAMLALIAEANSALAKAPSFQGKVGEQPLSTLPLYLLLGPEGSGKTSAFVASGLEPQLLAGEGTTPVSSTRLANLWFAKNAVFAEIGGRAFSGDPARWTPLLRLLRGTSTIPAWRRLLGESERHSELRGVIAFCDSQEFTGAASDPQRLERSVRNWQERLRAVAEVFGVGFPVYLAISKCDKIPFFGDFFRRLSESEANQVLGYTLPAVTDRSSSEVFAEAEAKRLTASFRTLYHALAQRRVTHLAMEPNPALRPGIYEFPRELKRIRSPLVQFLTDVFRPNTLGPAPVLRGYYLLGTRETEAALNDPAATRVDFAGLADSLETTRLFDGGATQLFQPGAHKSAGPGRFVPRWIFVTDLFHRVVLPDRLARPVVATNDRMERYRALALGTVCGLCILLCCGFAWSWGNNRGLLAGLRTAISARTSTHSVPASFDELHSLDQLRLQIRRLEAGLPWSYHWGLYSGDRVLSQARTAYFRRFQRDLLIDLNSLMVSGMDALPAAPDANAPYDPVYRVLKTHLTVTSGACAVDQPLVSTLLKEYRGRLAPNATPEWQALADRQIGFYAAELANGNPARLPEDMEARDHARQYLQQLKGVDRLYANIVASAATHVKAATLKDLAANYREVLSGPEGVDAVFSKEGLAYFEKASRESNPGTLGEACVVGQSPGVIGAFQRDAETARALDRMFLADYVLHWRKFVEGFSVLRYASAADAARKLEILSDHKSPLLAVLALTAGQTNFPQAETPAESAVRKKIDQLMKKGEEAAKPAAAPTDQVPDVPTAPVDLVRFFQPVGWVVPPGSDTWVTDKNAAYIDALSQLRHSMQDIAQAGRTPDPTIYQTAAQNYDKATDAVRQIAKGFKPVGVGNLDTTVEALLMAPIRSANPFIIRNFEQVSAQSVNAALQAFCRSQRTTLQKYPFQSSSGEDVGLADLAALLQPVSGALWKFQQQSLADLVVKEGGQWKAKDSGKKPQPTPDLLTWLNRAESAAGAFYPGGNPQPQLVYSLRPKLDPSFKDTILELEIDGKSYPFNTPLQKQFVWPASLGTPSPGAVARLRNAGFSAAFASRGGIWGIFRILADAEPRDFGSKLVEWKYTSGGVGRKEPIQPGPVDLEIVTFPGGIDVFNPKFWAGFTCPTQAAQ